MASTADFLSLRSSCERCRFHKLKCTLLSNALPHASLRCVRCDRAKVECVFGRRARGRRQNPIPTPTSIPDAVAAPLTVAQSLFLDEVTRKPRSGAAEVQGVHSTTWSSSLSRGHGSDDGPNRVPPDIIAHDDDLLPGYSPNSGQGFSNIFDPSALFALIDSQDPYPFDHQDQTMAEKTPMGAISREESEESCPDISVSSRDSSDTILRLATLVADIHEAASTIQNRQWTGQAEPCTLDDYPIGLVLPPSNEFVRILQSMPNFESLFTGTAGSMEHKVDPPTRLLILSNYLYLADLYSIVFTHLEAKLQMLPQAMSASELPSLGLTETPTLRVAELQCADDVWSRTYTAVRLLLDALQAVQEAIGIPAAFRAVRASPTPEPAPTKTAHGIGTSHDLFGEVEQLMVGQGLFHSVQSLKQLLRRKLSL